MLDGLDELLYSNPCEPPGPDFVDHIKANIALYRRRRKRARQAIAALWGMLALMGGALSLAHYDAFLAIMPRFSTQGIESWIELAVQSPLRASVGLLESTETLAREAMSQVEGLLIMAVMLLAIPAMIGLNAALGKTMNRDGMFQ